MQAPSMVDQSELAAYCAELRARYQTQLADPDTRAEAEATIERALEVRIQTLLQAAASGKQRLPDDEWVVW